MSNTDQWGIIGNISEPAGNAFAVTPHDTDELTEWTRALWVGTAGTLKVTTTEGNTVTFTNASGWMPIRVKLVFSTGTAASDIVGVY